MSDYTYEVVWKDMTPQRIEALVAFWIDNEAIPREEIARRRAPQAVVLVRDSDGRIVAVTTALGQFVRRLDAKLYIVRGFVAKPARQSAVARHMYRAARAALEAEFVEGRDTEHIGIYMEIESRILQRRNRAIWTEGPVFIGKTQRGDHIRVDYFEGAEI